MRGTIAVLALVLALTRTAGADVNQHMNDFFDGLLVNANIPMSPVDAQRAGHYSMGSVYLRTQEDNLQPMTVMLPSYRGGCGGIDIHMGGFSFVSLEELWSFMRAVGQQSISFAAYLALETISPTLSKIMADLQDAAQAINQFNMNSCETAAALVGSVWPRTEAASRVICETSNVGVNGNRFTDHVASRHGCGPNAQRYDTNRAADPSYQAQSPFGNLAWDALSEVRPRLLKEEKELLMTLLGTVIIRQPANEDGNPEVEYFAGKLADDNVLSVLLNGGPMRLSSCALNPPGECLALTQADFDVDVDQVNPERSSAFLPKTQGLLLGIMDKIRDRNLSLTDAERRLVNSTTLPIQKMISVYEASEGVSAASTIASYAEIIALDILSVFLVQAVEKTISSAYEYNHGAAELTRWRDSLVKQKHFLDEKIDKQLKKFGGVHAIIQNIQFRESLLASNLSRDLAEAYGFSRGLN